MESQSVFDPLAVYQANRNLNIQQNDCNVDMPSFCVNIKHEYIQDQCSVYIHMRAVFQSVHKAPSQIIISRLIFELAL